MCVVFCHKLYRTTRRFNNRCSHTYSVQRYSGVYASRPQGVQSSNCTNPPRLTLPLLLQLMRRQRARSRWVAYDSRQVITAAMLSCIDGGNPYGCFICRRLCFTTKCRTAVNTERTLCSLHVMYEDESRMSRRHYYWSRISLLQKDSDVTRGQTFGPQKRIVTPRNLCRIYKMLPVYHLHNYHRPILTVLLW